jgi:2'-5' RNA ligase
MSEPKRLFFAIELPADVQQQIVHWRAASFPAMRVDRWRRLTSI